MLIQTLFFCVAGVIESYITDLDLEFRELGELWIGKGLFEIRRWNGFGSGIPNIERTMARKWSAVRACTERRLGRARRYLVYILASSCSTHPTSDRTSEASDVM